MISERNRSTKEVTTPSPRTFHEFFTLRSVAMDGASLKTCSAYRAKNRSRPASILVRKLVLVPDRTCETASRLVPQEAQNFRSFKLSLPHVGQNIFHLSKADRVKPIVRRWAASNQIESTNGCGQAGAGSRSRGDDRDYNLSLAGTIALYQQDALPGAELKLPAVDWNRQARSD